VPFCRSTRDSVPWLVRFQQLSLLSCSQYACIWFVIQKVLSQCKLIGCPVQLIAASTDICMHAKMAGAADRL
jgi:hypothetical protein